MTSHFNPYLQWLGIPLERQPPDYYTLLGLPKFEPNQQQIDAAAENRMVYLRSLQDGPQGGYTQQLLNEIAQAKRCLLDPVAKSAYDASLHSTDSLLPAAATGPAAQGSINELAVSDAAQPESSDQVAVEKVLPWRPFVIIGVLSLLGFGIFYGFGSLITYLKQQEETRKRELDAWMIEQDDRQMAELSKTDRAEQPPGVLRIDRHYKLVASNATKLNGDLETENSAGRECISGWSGPLDKVIWELSVAHPGFYRVKLSYSLEGGDSDQALVLNTNGLERRNTLRASTGAVTSDECIIMLKEKGTSTIEVSTDGVHGTLKLFEVDLMPRS